MDERLKRQARNEALTRTVNEKIEALDRGAGWADSEHLFEFVCECGQGEGCGGHVQMTLAEYERVRRQDDRFAVVPGHENAELEDVVEEHARYRIVDKKPEYDSLVEH